MPLASRAARVLSLLAVPLLTVPLATASTGVLAPSAADAATPVVPRPPSRPLPAGLDVASPYQGQVYCDPVAKAGVLAFARLMTAHYGLGSTGGIVRNCNAGITEHSDGRAWDWMLNAKDPRQKATADAVTRWLAAPDSSGRPGAMARRFGIMYIIWNRTMWRAYAPERGWAPYTGSSPHTDHVHFSFGWDGALQRTSWWTGVPRTTVGGAPSSLTTPPPFNGTGYPVLRSGSRGADVMLLQRIVGVTADGAFGPMTETSLRAWQKSHGVAVTGVAEVATWTRILALGKAPSRLKTTKPVTTKPVTPKPVTTKPVTTKPVTPKPVTTKPVTTKPGVSTVSTTTSYSLLKGVRLGVGSSGTAVRRLQAALGGLTVDGAYGSRTAAAVARYRAAAKLPPGRTVDRSVWDALERRDHPLLAYRATVLRRGSTGGAVRALQRALRVGADGEFGPVTQAAVKAAQKRAGLSQNGIVGSVTWAAIEKAIRR